jgi:spore maturation protein CgeB
MPRGLNQRCFDVPASGGFLLTDAQPAIEELFEPEIEIITFQTQCELEEKWNYYSQRHAERKAVIEKGRKKVLNKHTYQHRIREMLHVADLWFT